MGHDASKVLLGVTGSSAKDVTQFAHDPATMVAGTAVRLKSDNTLSVTKSDGRWLGVSLGKSLSDHKKTAIVRAGELVPILLTDDEDDYAYVVPGASVWIDDATGLEIGRAHV